MGADERAMEQLGSASQIRTEILPRGAVPSVKKKTSRWTGCPRKRPQPESLNADGRGQPCGAGSGEVLRVLRRKSGQRCRDLQAVRIASLTAAAFSSWDYS